ncbi:hypothetical protein ACYUJ6_02885 [Clostridium sp. JNZ X4-2]
MYKLLMIIAVGLNMVGVDGIKMEDCLSAIIAAPVLCWMAVMM